MDIVKRLRAAELYFSEVAFGNLEWCKSGLPSEAADEIERLWGDKAFDEAIEVINEMGFEIGRLRERIAELEDPHYLKGREAEIERLRSGYQFIIEGHDGYTIALEMMSPAPSTDALEPKP